MAARVCQRCGAAAGVKNSHVLELGCGTGAAGLFAAALGAQRVLLTDGQAPETQLAALNARRHAELLAAGAPSTRGGTAGATRCASCWR